MPWSLKKHYADKARSGPFIYYNLQISFMKDSAGMRDLVIVLAFTLAQSLSFSWQENTITSKSGITSLLSIEGSYSVELFAGNKRGKVNHFLWTGNLVQSLGDMQDEEVDTRPFPIFSMTSTGCVAPFQIFCGGGDRYISVWHQTKDEKNWSCHQHLGPHTGWVKDILYDHRRDALYSIGCNCIERWERVLDADGDDEGLWTHAAKRSIESSLEEGATLSSDLLCLCACDEMHRFVAGGVDGRIHAWSLDPLLPDPLSSIAAHKGRINFLAYAPTSKLLFSSGHDGVLQCRRFSEAHTLNKIPDAHIKIMDANGSPARVTAFDLWQESDHSVHFVLGTANGELSCFQASIEHDTVALKETADSRFSFANQPVITAIRALKCQTFSTGNSTANLAIGHSLGLSLITIKR